MTAPDAAPNPVASWHVLWRDSEIFNTEAEYKPISNWCQKEKYSYT